MKHVLFPATLLLILWAMPDFSALAQPSSGGPAPTPVPTQTPLDGGASLLLVGGIGYTMRKLRQRRAK